MSKKQETELVDDPTEELDLDNIPDAGDDDDFEVDPAARGDFIGEDDEPEVEEEDDEPEVEEEDDEPEVEEEDDEPEDDVPEVDEPPTVEAKPEKKIRIPKERLDAEIARRKDLERQLREMGERSKDSEQATNRLAEISTRIEEIDNELSTALLEGDQDAIKKLRTEERKLNKELMDGQLREVRTQAREETQYDLAVAAMEEEYPELNPDSDAYNEEFVEEVLDLKEAFQMKGYTPTTALKRAVAYVMPARGEVVEEEAPASKPTLRKTTTDKKRNAAAKKAQPASTANRRAATDTDSIDVYKLSEDDIARMDKKQLAKLRGDIF